MLKTAVQPPIQSRTQISKRRKIWFGETEGDARNAYRNHAKKGIEQGRRPEIVEGGLIRSMGGWSDVKAMSRSGDRKIRDGVDKVNIFV